MVRVDSSQGFRDLHLKRLVLLVVAATLISCPATGQDCEPPLFVIQSSAGANVMILMDTSLSMNEPIYHEAYDPGTMYPGNFSTYSAYWISATGDYSPSSFNGGWSTSPSARLIRSDNGQSGLYYGNYLNWIYYKATEDQRNNIPQVTRIQVGKLVMTDLIGRIDPRIRVGLTVFSPTNEGGNVIGNCGVNFTSMISQINGITANTWTPLGESMETLVDYFKDDLPSAPIQNSCQQNFIIICTDGYPTKDTNVSSYLHDADGDGNDPGNCASIGAPAGYPSSYDCSDHVDDVAYYLRMTDLRPDLGEPGETGQRGQNCYTYTIGFALDAPLLEETAKNGGGLYYTADNAAELANAFDQAMQDILMRISAGSSVAVVSTERGDDNTLYRGKFMPGSWAGYMEAFSLPYEDGEFPSWEGGRILADRVDANDDRIIYSAVGNTEVKFVPEEADQLWEAMEADDAIHAAELITWARGNHVLGYRDRGGWVLGDIVHSAPVVVGAPSNFTTDEEYQDFMANYQNRQKAVYVGANDGMLHAFHGDTGEELWAFVPEFAMPKFKVMADSSYCHTYSVDLTPAVADLQLNTVWRTVLIGGGRMGGSSYFCLDVTYPNSPSFLWQVDLPDGKPFPSEIEMTNIAGTPVMLVGSGLDTDTDLAGIYAYNVEDGSLLGAKLLSSGSSGRNKATKPCALDYDLDGNADVVYIADMEGSIWRGEVDDNLNPLNWSWSEFFSCNREITAAPTLAYGEGNKYLIYVGTGAYLDEDDFNTTNTNAFYCIFDTGSGGTHVPSDLANQTGTPGDIGDADGWYVELTEHGVPERVTEPAVVVAGVAYFTSFEVSGDVCSAGGQSWLYGVSYDDGNYLTDEAGDEIQADTELPGGIASRPVADIVSGNVIIQTTDSSITVEDINQTYFHLIVKSWQEFFDVAPAPTAEEIN